MTKVSAARNRERGKQDEKDVAEILGAKRHWANSGGPEDCEHDWLAIQIKGGLRVVNDTFRDGMAAAKAAAVGKTKLPALVLVDRAGTRVKRYIAFPLEDWVAWNLPPKEATE